MVFIFDLMFSNNEPTVFMLFIISTFQHTPITQFPSGYNNTDNLLLLPLRDQFINAWLHRREGHSPYFHSKVCSFFFVFLSSILRKEIENRKGLFAKIC